MLITHTGGTRHPSGIAGRVFRATWWMFCVTLSATYTGNLVAFISVYLERLPYNTFTEIAAQTDYKVAILGGTSSETRFRVRR